MFSSWRKLQLLIATNMRMHMVVRKRVLYLILSYFFYPSNLSMLVIAKGGKPSVSQPSRHVPNPGVVMKIPWAMGPNPGVPSLGAGTSRRDTNLRQEFIFLARFNRKFIFQTFFFETCLLFSFLNVEPIFWATEKPGKENHIPNASKRNVWASAVHIAAPPD
jgi:hypothetical protein